VSQLTGTPVIYNKCPPIGWTDFMVTVRDARCPMDIGCAAIDYRADDSPVIRSFSVWLGRLDSGNSSCRDPSTCKKLLLLYLQDSKKSILV